MKTKLFLGLALGTIMLNSCQNEKVEYTIGKTTALDEKIPVCIDKTLNSNSSNKS